MVLEELKQYFASNGTVLNTANEYIWRELKQFLLDRGEKVGSIRCGSCRRKMLNALNQVR